MPKVVTKKVPQQAADRLQSEGCDVSRQRSGLCYGNLKSWHTVNIIQSEGCEDRL